MNDGEFFVDFVIKQLVEYPEDVLVERTLDERGVLFSVTVNPSDMGRVIGRGGNTANGLRSLLYALGRKNEALYSLKIIDTNIGEAK